MTTTSTHTVVQAAFVNTDTIYEEVERVVDVLPSELDQRWLDGIDDGNSPWIEENNLLLRVGFWDAVRDAVKAMLIAGYTLTPPKG